MDIDELQTVQSKERQKDSLQHLRDSFYEDVAAYIEELKAERDSVADATDEPFSDPEVSRLTDDIERAEDVVEAIYERRVGKVVKMASFAAADMPVEEEGLTTQERDLFEEMVGRIGENRSRVLDILAGEGDAVPTTSGAAPGAQPGPTEGESPTDSASTDPASTNRSSTDPSPPDEAPARSEPAVETGTSPTEETDSQSDEPPAPLETSPEEEPPTPPEEPNDTRPDGGVTADTSRVATADASGASKSDSPGASNPVSSSDDASDSSGVDTAAASTSVAAVDEERTTVRVTEDVGRMLGVDDREYELKREDVVSLPEDNAEALLQREAAERLW